MDITILDYSLVIENVILTGVIVMLLKIFISHYDMVVVVFDSGMLMDIGDFMVHNHYVIIRWLLQLAYRILCSSIVIVTGGYRDGISVSYVVIVMRDSYYFVIILLDLASLFVISLFDISDRCTVRNYYIGG